MIKKLFILCALFLCGTTVSGMSFKVNDNEFTNFQDALKNCNSNCSIEITQNIKASETLTIPSGKQINMISKGSIKIERAEDFWGPIFSVENGASLSISGEILFIGKNKFKEQSPFIQNLGQIELEGITFKNNGSANALKCKEVISDIKGGTIFSKGNAKISKCLIQDNESAYGAGICNGGTLSLENTVIQKNRSVHEGAGIYSLGTLKLKNCYLKNNIVDIGGGGGIFNNGECELTDSKVNKNWLLGQGDSKTACGGGVLNYGIFKAENCSFNENKSGNGGGIFSAGEYCELNQCEINNNKTSEIDRMYLQRKEFGRQEYIFLEGGLSNLFLGGGIYFEKGKFSILNSKISGNIAHIGGGAYINSKQCDIKMENTEFSNNKASEKHVAKTANEMSTVQHEYMLAMMPSMITADGLPNAVMPVSE